jgi:electron transfer flavoprotein alpha subunit/Pyruvate/2-oxoacid:ferredoxin oxidoreductase delta subunit
MSNHRIQILEDRCTGCGLCVKACPFGAISLRERKAVIDYDACTLCGACASVCRKFNAIEVQGDTRRGPTGQSDVWVVCETDESGDALAHVSRELLGAATRLAGELKVGVGAVLVGHGLDAVVEEAGRFGAARIFVADAPELAVYRDEPYAAILANLIRRETPEIILGGATAVGRALLPRVAVMVHAGLTADCTELSIDPETGLLLQTRPAFGGNILATITCEQHRPQMATVRPGVLPDPAPLVTRASEPAHSEVVRVPLVAADLRSAIEWLGFTPKARGGVDLREAEIIVAAGYGVGGPDGVDLVARFAEKIGGVLGATRAVVDAGWVEYAHQVGQTGTTVQPKLYIACGLSGAIQHIVGMQSSDKIIAINKDPEAPIFDYADVAVVGDVLEIVPKLLALGAGSPLP